jgi:hypothetical protein
MNSGSIHLSGDLEDRFLGGTGDAGRNRGLMELEDHQSGDQQGKKEKDALLAGRVAPERTQASDGSSHPKGRTQRL